MLKLCDQIINQNEFYSFQIGNVEKKGRRRGEKLKQLKCWARRGILEE
jgi:hypothetical protein